MNDIEMRMMREIHAELVETQRKLSVVAALVKLRMVVDSFSVGEHTIREGDSFTYDMTTTRLLNVSSDGRWTFNNGWQTIEVRTPPDGARRLYTIEEVGAIIAVDRESR